MLAVGVEHAVGLTAGLHFRGLVADHLRIERLRFRRVVRPELRPAPAAVAHRAAERALRLREDQRRAVRVLQDRELAPALDLGDVGADRGAGGLRGRDRLLRVGDVDRREPGRLGDVRDRVLIWRDARERRAVAPHQIVAAGPRVDLPAEESRVEPDRRDRVIALEHEPVDLARGLRSGRARRARRPSRRRRRRTMRAEGNGPCGFSLFVGGFGARVSHTPACAWSNAPECLLARVARYIARYVTRYS